MIREVEEKGREEDYLDSEEEQYVFEAKLPKALVLKPEQLKLERAILEEIKKSKQARSDFQTTTSSGRVSFSSTT